MDTHGELALLAAIDAGRPVATNAAQAAELERLNGAKHAAKVAEKITVTGTGPFTINFPGEDPMEAVSFDAVTLEMLLNFARSLGRVQVRMEILADAERRANALIGGAA